MGAKIIGQDFSEIFFQKAFDATCEWFESGMTSPARVKDIRRWAKMGGCTLDEMIDYAEEFLANIAE
jgi:hypothetical protein